MKTFALAGAAFFAVTAAANAATVGSTNFDFTVLSPGSTHETVWDVGDTAWDINDVSVTVNGFSAGADVPLASITLTNSLGTSTYNDWTIRTSGSSASGTLSFAGFDATEDFTLTFNYGEGALPLLANYTFTASPIDTPAPVPLPASALLLLAGVGGLAGLRKLRAKA